MPCRPEAAALLLLLLAVAGCGNDRRTTACDDEPGVTAAGKLPDDPAGVRFVELWRIGSSHEDEQLGFPLSLALSADGRAAIADFQLSELYVVEPDGGWRGSIARRGRGPGEFASPVAAVWADDGTLHVLDIMRPAILRFAPDLSFAGEVPVPAEVVAATIRDGELAWAGIEPSGAVLLQAPHGPAGNDGLAIETLLRYPAGAAVADTIARAAAPVVEAPNAPRWAVPGWARLSAHVGAGGRLAIAGETADYRVAVLDGNASARLRLCAERAGEPLSPAERGGDAPEGLEPLGAAIAAAPRPAEPAAVGRVVLGADGTVWVERQRRSPYPDMYSWLHGSPGSTYDIFSPDGRHVRTLRLPAGARLQGALGSTVWVYEVSAMDEVTLVAYRIELSE